MTLIINVQGIKYWDIQYFTGCKYLLITFKSLGGKKGVKKSNVTTTFHSKKLLKVKGL